MANRMYKGYRPKSITGISVLLPVLLSAVPLAASSRESTLVSEAIAFEHAAVALVQHVLIPIPSLFEDQQPEYGWEGARIGAASLVYDINRQPLLHIFPVLTEDDVISGSIWVSADMALGTTVVAIHANQEFPDFEAAKEGARRVAKSKYPAWDVQSIAPVVYSYPRVGLMLKMDHPETARKADLILDLYDLSEAPKLARLIDNLRDGDISANASWSLFDDVSSEERKERIRRWKVRHIWESKIKEILSESDGFPKALKSAPLKTVLDLNAVSRRFYAQTQCEIYTTRNPWPRFCQSGIPFCAAAVGRNIAGYYGVWQLESKVAQLMGITKNQWPTVQGEVTYYKSPQGLKKSGTESYTSDTPKGIAHLSDWRSFKLKLQQDNDFLIPSSIGLGYGPGAPGPGGWQQPGHWNALYSMKVCRSPEGDESVIFGVFDPYPPTQCGGDQFEYFSILKGKIRSHTIPKDPGAPPTYPAKPTFEPWKCALHWYKMLYPGSCKKWEELVKRISRPAVWRKSPDEKGTGSNSSDDMH